MTGLFVSPFQFRPGEDLDASPRTPGRDAKMLEQVGNHYLSRPRRGGYPNGREGQTFVEVPGVSDILCGASRPRHPRRRHRRCQAVQHRPAGYRGLRREDYQQLIVIRRMTADLDLHGRDRRPSDRARARRSGHEFSQRLSDIRAARAPVLLVQLQRLADALKAGEDSADAEWDAARRLAASGFKPDYVSVCRRSTSPSSPVTVRWWFSRRPTWARRG